MAENDFWDLISVLARGDLDDLVSSLSNLSPEQILAFYDQLATKVSGLNTSGHRKQAAFDEGFPDDPIQPDTDEFEDLRLAVVLAGRTTWEETVREPTKLRGTWRLEAAEDLALAAEYAYEKVADQPWPPLSLDKPSDGVDQDVPPYRRKGWLFLLALNHLWEGGLHNLPETYYDALESVRDQLNSNDDWLNWWTAITGDDCQLVAELQYSRAGKTRVTIRDSQDFAGRPEVAVSAVVPILDKSLRAEGRSAVVGRAHQDAVIVIEKVAAKYRKKLPADVPTP